MHRLFWKIFFLLWIVSAGVFSAGVFIARLHHTDEPLNYPVEEEAQAALEAYEDNRLTEFYSKNNDPFYPARFLLNEKNQLLPIGYVSAVPVPVVTEFPFHKRLRYGPASGVIRGIEVESRSGVVYRFVVKYRLKRSRGGPPIFFPLFFIAFAATSVLLAAYITRPLRKLQVVVRRFAAGEHDARMSKRYTARRDVLGEVGREFNVMAERLNAQIESQRKLLRDISHELRTPLARMQVAVAIAEDKTSGAADSLARLHIEIERLDQLIGQVLTLSRIESGADTLHKAPVILCGLLQQLTADAEFEFSEQEKTVRLYCPEDIVLSADEIQLHSSIENVLRNAMRYTPAGGQVEVSAERLPVSGLSAGEAGQPLVRLLVKDQGPGVSAQSLPKIFDAFYREDDSRHAGSGGHGVGLAIARSIIIAHGGRIAASNQLPRGLQLEIVLPVSG